MTYHHILAAYDGSKAAKKALEHAVAIASIGPNTKLTVAHVLYRPVFDIGSFAYGSSEEYMKQVEQFETSIMEHAREIIAPIPYSRIVVLTGNPVPAILDYAKDNHCDLIVMGSRGLGAIQEWMLGSVSHHVVQKAQVPVLVVK
ncbi:universal stress protein [Cohnella pontilimi]|uniref:Universal stress protein n=1 Tax=Cohnella pontilimi TaxID=2564100 RepID=A0A4U0F983_9BACL|nr:universal stress protein [Cohnella pontilimi]TJY41140.1 universal stress protein [Cohnella pontilimi]